VAAEVSVGVPLIFAALALGVAILLTLRWLIPSLHTAPSLVPFTSTFPSRERSEARNKERKPIFDTRIR